MSDSPPRKSVKNCRSQLFACGKTDCESEQPRTDDPGCNQQTHGPGRVIQVISHTVSSFCASHTESAAHPDDQRSTSHDADKDTRGLDGPRQANGRAVSFSSLSTNPD